MAADDQVPLDDDPDPSADTPEIEVEDTTEADDQPGSDPAARLAEAQATITRQAQELALFRGKAQADEPVTEPPSDAQSNDFLARATQDSWALAEAIHGTEALDAYRVAYRLYEAAATPADFVTAFEAYHDLRSGKVAAPAKGSVKPSRAAATTPKVDANRSDPGPDLANADEKLAEARKGSSLGAFAAAAAAKMGYGPSR
jgi:hypothetical protein